MFVDHVRTRRREFVDPRNTIHIDPRLHVETAFARFADAFSDAVETIRRVITVGQRDRDEDGIERIRSGEGHTASNSVEGTE